MNKCFTENLSTLENYMEQFAQSVQRKITNLGPSSICLISDFLIAQIRHYFRFIQKSRILIQFVENLLQWTVKCD